MAKRKTMTQRIEEIEVALHAMRASIDKAAFTQGCRAANPAKHDNAETRDRENAQFRHADRCQSAVVKLVNRAIRAARKPSTTLPPDAPT